MSLLRLVVILSVVLCFSTSPSAHGRQIKGRVLADNGAAVHMAAVRVQATNITTVTGVDGRFVLENAPAGNCVITAWKEGFLIGGIQPPVDGGEAIIKLHPSPSHDNPGYKWISSDFPTLWQKISIVFWRAVSVISANDKLKSRYENNCSNCHADTTIPQWRRDAHSHSDVNPLLLTMYNGTDVKGTPRVFPGYKIDFPNSAGNCANCHAPTRAVANPWGTDLGKAASGSNDGISCDFCHKIKDVELHVGGGYPGILSIKFNRPPPGEQVFYGPHDDVSAGPDTYSPLYKKSRFCAPCHSASFWGTPIYSEYDEWLKSPYPGKGVECQDCHMASDGKTAYFVPPEKKGVARDTKTIATHYNPGSRDRKFISDALKIGLTVTAKRGFLEAAVTIKNEKAGHHIPTGVPMRNMILLVEATDHGGKKLDYAKGPIVPAWGGEGSVENGNYAGLPGKGFAKILGDISNAYPGKFNPGYQSPTPHWRQAQIVSDTRIPAGATDESRYRFALNGTAKGESCSKIKMRLIYRRMFKPWLDAKGFPLGDMEIARREIELCK